MNWRPKSFVGQTLATTIAALLAAQILSGLFFGLFVLKPQAERVAGIVAQSVAAVSDAAELSAPPARAAIIARLDASPYIDVWPGNTQPPKTGPRPGLLERMFLQALVEALKDRTELPWRTDQQRRLWIEVRIGPDLYWISAQSPTSLQPFNAILASGAAAFLLALVAVVALQRRISRPLENLTAAVQAYGPHSRPTPVDEQGPEELVALSRGFNAMTARLAAADEERAFLLAGVSHDLRTPLAKLRLAVELLAPGDAAPARAAHGYVAEIDRVLGQFLTFARGFEAEPVVLFDVSALLSEMVAMRAVEGHDFELLSAPSRLLHGRPEALRRALGNLTENAIRYGATPFAIGAQDAPGGVDLFVCDGGKGAPPARLHQLSRPFARGGETSTQPPGTGLGLAIAERVAQLHSGALTLTNLSPMGFEARLHLKG